MGNVLAMTELNFVLRRLLVFRRHDVGKQANVVSVMVFMSHLSEDFNMETNIIFDVKWSSVSDGGQGNEDQLADSERTEERCGERNVLIARVTFLKTQIKMIIVNNRRGGNLDW